MLKLKARDAFLSENKKHLNKILVRTRHQCGISELVPQTLLRRKTMANGGVSKCRLFSQARRAGMSGIGDKTPVNNLQMKLLMSIRAQAQL